MSKEEKQRLHVSNIYDHNASMKLDKERDHQTTWVSDEGDEGAERWYGFDEVTN